MSDAIRARHASVRQGVRLKPRNMTRMTVAPGERDTLERMAVGIFTDCTNANMSFRDALAAILLSGMLWGAIPRDESEQ